MNKFLTLRPTTALALVLAAFLITGCSSGGGGSNNDGDADDGGGGTTGQVNTSPAAIDANNTEDIGKAAGEAIQTADASTGLPGAVVINSSPNLERINNIIISAVNTSNLPAGLDVSDDLCQSGTAETTTNRPSESGELSNTFTFNNCVLVGTESSLTVSGTSVWRNEDVEDLNSGFSITYSNFIVVDSLNNTTTRANVTFSCSNFSNIAACTYTSDFIGDDGVTHRVANFDISGNRTLGFNGSATFFHGTFGEVKLSITNIKYGSCGVFPDGGTVNYTSSDESSGTITFNGDCTVSGTWSNSSGSGSFPT